MMNLWVLLYIAVLFFVLTPGILVSLPSGGSKTTVAAVHALVFAVIFHFTHKLVWNLTKSVSFGHLEGFESTKKNGWEFSDSYFNTPLFPVGHSYSLGK
jgi:hypothetical protein